MKNEIPKIIHQSWKNENIPFDIYRKSWVDSWGIHHPDWERILWTDEQNKNLVKEHYPDFYPFFLSLYPNIKKADFCRLLYMHRYGGVYVDLDFICLKNLSSLLDEYELVLGRLSVENPYYQIPNAFMASRPGLDFWLKTARDAMNAPAWEQAVEKHAGPLRLEWAYYKYQPGNSVVYDHDIIYPFDWINFTGWDNGKYYKKELAQLSEELKNKSIEEIATVFPQAFCLTFWTHNW